MEVQESAQHCSFKNKSRETLWEKEQLDHLSDNSTDLWRNVKSRMDCKNFEQPTQLFVNKIITKLKEIADTIDNFFINKVKNLQKEIPEKRK